MSHPLRRSDRAVFLLTGISAAGKSTVAQLLAERFDRAAHVRGDVFRRMVISGRAEMTPDAGDEAGRQLELRYRLGAATADAYFEQHFSVIVQDVVLGDHLRQYVSMIRSRPLLVVVLCPTPEVVAQRERERVKDAYANWSPAALDRVLRNDTPPLGLWIDSSEQSADETTTEILSRAWNDARV